jgi:Spy/CpxP family protein refolding chaperone
MRLTSLSLMERVVQMQLRHALAVLALGICCAWPALSQDTGKNSRPGLAVAQKEKGTAATEKKPVRRLPNYYGKLDLTDAQKETIYTLQAKYGGQIDALEDQIKMLKDKRDAEIEAVLTDVQKQKLKTLQADAKKKKDDKTGKPSQDADDDKE